MKRCPKCQWTVSPCPEHESDPVVFSGPQFGVSQAQHDAVVAERDALKAEVEKLQRQNVAPLANKIDELNREANRLREALEFVSRESTDLFVARKAREVLAAVEHDPIAVQVAPQDRTADYEREAQGNKGGGE